MQGIQKLQKIIVNILVLDTNKFRIKFNCKYRHSMYMITGKCKIERMFSKLYKSWAFTLILPWTKQVEAIRVFLRLKPKVMVSYEWGAGQLLYNVSFECMSRSSMRLVIALTSRIKRRPWWTQHRRMNCKWKLSVCKTDPGRTIILKRYTINTVPFFPSLARQRVRNAWSEWKLASWNKTKANICETSSNGVKWVDCTRWFTWKWADGYSKESFGCST